jgi:hypothetical protein
MRALRKLCRRLGFDVVPFRKGVLPPDFDAEDQRIISAVRPYTMTGPERLFAMIHAARHVARRPVAGAFVECGVWRGGSMMAAALALKALGCVDRELFLFDTFEGMTQPTARDVNYKGALAIDTFNQKRLGEDSSDWCRATLEDVRAALDSTGYPRERVHLVKGKVEETLPAQAPEQIALLRLDTDWYESTRHELEHLYPRLATGGVLIIDDYGHWKGSREATEEYIAKHNLKLLLHRTDGPGRMAIKL